MTHIVTLQLTLTQPKVILTREIVWTIPLSFEGNKEERGGGTLNDSSAWLTSIQPSSNQQEGRDEERNSARFPQS